MVGQDEGSWHDNEGILHDSALMFPHKYRQISFTVDDLSWLRRKKLGSTPAHRLCDVYGHRGNYWRRLCSSMHRMWTRCVITGFWIIWWEPESKNIEIMRDKAIVMSRCGNWRNRGPSKRRSAKDDFSEVLFRSCIYESPFEFEICNGCDTGDESKVAQPGIFQQLT